MHSHNTMEYHNEIFEYAHQNTQSSYQIQHNSVLHARVKVYIMGVHVHTNQERRKISARLT